MLKGIKLPSLWSKKWRAFRIEFTSYSCKILLRGIKLPSLWSSIQKFDAIMNFGKKVKIDLVAVGVRIWKKRLSGSWCCVGHKSINNYCCMIR